MKNEIKNYVFLKNGDFDRNLDFFALALPTHVSDPFSFCSFQLLPDFRPPTRFESACLYIGGGASLDLTTRQKGRSHDVAHEAWQRPYYER